MESNQYAAAVIRKEFLTFHTMQEINKNNLYLRILEFSEAHPTGFTYRELKESLNLEEWENNIVRRYLYNAVLNNNKLNKVLHETIFLKINISQKRSGNQLESLESFDLIGPSEGENIDKTIGDSYFILKYDAYFNYIDYLELREAMRNSRNAMIIAIASLIIAIVIGAFQINLTGSSLYGFLSNLCK